MGQQMVSVTRASTAQLAGEVHAITTQFISTASAGVNRRRIDMLDALAAVVQECGDEVVFSRIQPNKLALALLPFFTHRRPSLRAKSLFIAATLQPTAPELEQELRAIMLSDSILPQRILAAATMSKLPGKAPMEALTFLAELGSGIGMLQSLDWDTLDYVKYWLGLNFLDLVEEEVDRLESLIRNGTGSAAPLLNNVSTMLEFLISAIEDHYERLEKERQTAVPTRPESERSLHRCRRHRH